MRPREYKLLTVEGLPFPYYFNEEQIKQAINFQAKPGDIYIVSCHAFILTQLTCSLHNAGHIPEVWYNMDEIHCLVHSEPRQAASSIHERPLLPAGPFS